MRNRKRWPDGPYLNRRHRRATLRYLRALSFGVWDASRSAAAGYYMMESIERMRNTAGAAGVYAGDAITADGKHHATYDTGDVVKFKGDVIAPIPKQESA